MNSKWSNISMEFHNEMNRRRKHFKEFRYGGNAVYFESYLRTYYHPPKLLESYIRDIRFTY